MDNETLKTANKLKGEIEELEKHLRYANGRNENKKIVLYFEYRNDNGTKDVIAVPEYLPLTIDDMFELYKSKLSAAIQKLEKELEAL